MPDLDTDGFLPAGIHAAALHEVEARFGRGTDASRRQIELLRQVVEAAQVYSTIKRVLVWGSFVTDKPAPNDLDYSLIVSVEHQRTQIAPEHRRFLVPFAARQYYGVDRNYLVIKDYPPDYYSERVDFLCRDRALRPRGIVEISLRGEVKYQEP